MVQVYALLRLVHHPPRFLAGVAHSPASIAIVAEPLRVHVVLLQTVVVLEVSSCWRVPGSRLHSHELAVSRSPEVPETFCRGKPPQGPVLVAPTQAMPLARHPPLVPAALTRGTSTTALRSGEEGRPMQARHQQRWSAAHASAMLSIVVEERVRRIPRRVAAVRGTPRHRPARVAPAEPPPQTRGKPRSCG